MDPRSMSSRSNQPVPYRGGSLRPSTGGLGGLGLTTQSMDSSAAAVRDVNSARSSYHKRPDSSKAPSKSSGTATLNDFLIRRAEPNRQAPGAALDDMSVSGRGHGDLSVGRLLTNQAANASPSAADSDKFVRRFLKNNADKVLPPDGPASFGPELVERNSENLLANEINKAMVKQMRLKQHHEKRPAHYANGHDVGKADASSKSSKVPLSQQQQQMTPQLLLATLCDIRNKPNQAGQVRSELLAEHEERIAATVSDKFKGSIPHLPAPQHSSQATDANAATSNMVTIHVYDEAKSTTKDFECDRDILTRSIKYFQQYLDDRPAGASEITVHCDIKIFDWLMSYIKAEAGDKTVKKPRLTARLVVSILISSAFLKIGQLVDVCLAYCHENINDVIKSPTNMVCITNTTLDKLCDLFSHAELGSIHDPKDKFISKLYWKKLEKAFGLGQPASDLFRCEHCQRVLRGKYKDSVACIGAGANINSDGSWKYAHKIDVEWDVNEFLATMRIQGKSALSIYWRIWGLVMYLKCARCEQLFPCAELECCRHCPGTQMYAPEATAVGLASYSCCSAKNRRFPSSESTNGCSFHAHAPLDVDKQMLQDLEAHRDSILLPAGGPPFQMTDDVSMADVPGPLLIFNEDEVASGLLPAAAGGPADLLVDTQPEPTSERPSTSGIASQKRPSTSKSKRRFTATPKDPHKFRKENLSLCFNDRVISSVPMHNEPYKATKYALDIQRAMDSERMDEMVAHLKAMRTGQDEASREEDDKRANTTFDKVEERLQAIAAAAALRTKQEEEERKMARRSRSSSALKY